MGSSGPDGDGKVGSVGNDGVPEGLLGDGKGREGVEDGEPEGGVGNGLVEPGFDCDGLDGDDGEPLGGCCDGLLELGEGKLELGVCCWGVGNVDGVLGIHPTRNNKNTTLTPR